MTGKSLCETGILYARNSLSQRDNSHFYGRDLRIERAPQGIEGAYAQALQRSVKSNLKVESDTRLFLKNFWTLQHLRTEAASIRAAQMTNEMAAVAEVRPEEFRMTIKEAVQLAMSTVTEAATTVYDLKVCLVHNRTHKSFVTSDDPAVLTNRWYQSDQRARGMSPGMGSAGAILILPMSPNVMMIAYDGDVYTVPNREGHADLTRIEDVDAFNAHQYMNCRSTIFFSNWSDRDTIKSDFAVAQERRPIIRHRITYAVQVESSEWGERYKVVEASQRNKYDTGLIHTQSIMARPNRWPTLIKWRGDGKVWSNGSGINFVRRSVADTSPAVGFCQFRSRK